MQFFVDTAEIADIKKLYEMGLLDGVTTNPSLVAKSGRNFKEVIKEICEIVPGPVSAEVASTEYDGMSTTRLRCVPPRAATAPSRECCTTRAKCR